MKLEIKLDDPKSCNGCPGLNDRWGCCNLMKLKYLLTTKIGKAGDYFVRPQECIEKNGE